MGPPPTSFPAAPWTAKGQMVPRTEQHPPGCDLEHDKQSVSQQMWESQEEDLTRRVTHLENLIRRSVELKAIDVPAVKREERMDAMWQYEEWHRTHDLPFSWSYYGPIPGQLDEQAPRNPGYYLLPDRAIHQATLDYEEACRVMQWRMRHPVTMALAGDYKYLKHELFLDEGDEYGLRNQGEFYNRATWGQAYC
jgi:hypothetical protein